MVATTNPDLPEVAAAGRRTHALSAHLRKQQLQLAAEPPVPTVESECSSASCRVFFFRGRRLDHLEFAVHFRQGSP
jgi:hypothetical protein